MKTRNVVGLPMLGLVTLVLLNSCKTIPKNAVAVKPFDIKKYLGKWYEIARFDFRFERNLNNTTADYSLNKDGSIKVVNRGYNYKTGKWKEATGKAKFVSSPNEAKLKVSFFGPFYSGYNVIELDDNYTYALIAGKNLDYLWLLSREKTMPENIKQRFLQKATALGYDVKKLIWVKQE
ncbi:lipocalin family protein [Segetibacter koreensis]|uniref:lipocalin family protein n=1 Tax=Segetibacter koreensis TaxID=398037 RepID=UPI00047702A4|nr:lipocalin family protein [Segetibacter koreensis]